MNHPEVGHQISASASIQLLWRLVASLRTENYTELWWLSFALVMRPWKTRLIKVVREGSFIQEIDFSMGYLLLTGSHGCLRTDESDACTHTHTHTLINAHIPRTQMERLTVTTHPQTYTHTHTHKGKTLFNSASTIYQKMGTL